MYGWMDGWLEAGHKICRPQSPFFNGKVQAKLKSDKNGEGWRGWG